MLCQLYRVVAIVMGSFFLGVLLFVFLGLSIEYFLKKIALFSQAQRINDRLLVIEHHLETLVKNRGK